MKEVLFDSRAVAITLSFHGVLLVVMFAGSVQNSVPLALSVHKQSGVPHTDVLVKTFTRQTFSQSQRLKNIGAPKITTEKKKIIPRQKQSPVSEKIPGKIQKKVLPKVIEKTFSISDPISISQNNQGIWEQGGIDMRKLIRSVHATVHASWKPPSGIKKGTRAQVMLEIDARGYIKSFQFKERSGVLLFDQSIQLAQRSWRFCKRLFSSSLTLHLMG